MGNAVRDRGRARGTAPFHVVIVGSGGNIGSHLVPHVARIACIGRVTLIDRDAYERSNLGGQDITPHDIGRRKAAVQVAGGGAGPSRLEVTAHASAVETLPAGELRSDAILACLDSRAARQYVNEMAWRLGVPWIDAGVDGGSLLARINVYVPGAESPCLECAWDDHDYAALEQRYSCAPGETVPASTNAPSSVGAVAAALQAIECRKLLIGSPTRAFAGRQVLIDLAYHKHYVTAFRRNPSCRLSDHAPWTILALPTGPRHLTAADALRLGGTSGAIGLGVAGGVFAVRAFCSRCGREARGLRVLRGGSSLRVKRCARCGGRMVSPGSAQTEELTPDLLRGQSGRRSLASFGIRPRDILIVRTRRGSTYHEIGGDRE